MAIGKVLFPPTVPNSLPAFDKNADLRYYFKPSIANTIQQAKHVQVSIVYLDTNISALDKSKYLFELMFIPMANVQLDEKKGFYYFSIPKEIYQSKGDILYKIQIRLGETELVIASDGSITNASAILKDFDKMSEWSIVTLMLPITVPDFGIQGFDLAAENRIASTGFTFSGYYDAKDPNKKETLNLYRYNIYSYTSFEDKSTWKLVSTSGDKLIGMETKLNMSFVFPVELKEKEHYIVTLAIKTKNLYTNIKTYKVYSASYPVLEQFNSIQVKPDDEEGRVNLVIRGKQILLNKTPGTEVTYTKELPPGSGMDSVLGTHAKIVGSVYNNDNFSLTSIDGKWIIQSKMRFDEALPISIREFSENPIILVEKVPYLTSSKYYVKIKIGAVKINTAYATPAVIKPEPQWSYRIVARKELFEKKNGKETLILEQQTAVKLSNPITPDKEYYVFLKEDNGSLQLQIIE